MAAQTAIHASIPVPHVAASTPELKRVVGSRLRGNDVGGYGSAIFLTARGIGA
jgi:hypothetical protein